MLTGLHGCTGCCGLCSDERCCEESWRWLQKDQSHLPGWPCHWPLGPSGVLQDVSIISSYHFILNYSQQYGTCQMLVHLQWDMKVLWRLFILLLQSLALQNFTARCSLIGFCLDFSFFLFFMPIILMWCSSWKVVLCLGTYFLLGYLTSSKMLFV